MAKSSTEYQRDYLQRRRKRAATYLGGKCKICSTTKSLEFDHIDREIKTKEISNAIAEHWAWSKLVAELDKCQLLCSSCHQKKTTAEQYEPQKCGTYWKYRKYKCRCELCIAANSRQLRIWKGK